MEDYYSSDTPLYIVLSPDLELSPTQFVAVWNKEKECREVAAARLLPPASQQYDFSLFAEILLSFVINIGSSTVYDLVKKALAKRAVPSTTVVNMVHWEEKRKPGSLTV